jgi:hypothetical protein
MADRVVKLSRRYEVPGQVPFDSLTLREPTYRDIFMSGLGAPRETHWSNGGAMVITHYEVVDQYLEKLVKSPEYPAIAVLDAVDSMEVCNAVCGFFRKTVAETTE